MIRKARPKQHTVLANGVLARVRGFCCDGAEAIEGIPPAHLLQPIAPVSAQPFLRPPAEGVEVSHLGERRVDLVEVNHRIQSARRRF